MSKGFGIALSTLLFCLPVQIVLSEDVQALSIQDRKAEADRLIQQGVKLYQTSRYREAIQVLESALGIYRDIKDRNGEATSLNNMGLAYNDLGQYQKAIDSYQQSSSIFKQLGDYKGEGNALHHMGEPYRTLGQYRKAIEVYQKALANFKQIEISKCNPDGKTSDCVEVLEEEKRVLDSLGLIYGMGVMLQIQNSIDFEQQALAIQKKIVVVNCSPAPQSSDCYNARYWEGWRLSNLSHQYISLAQYPKAIDSYQQALVIFKQIRISACNPDKKNSRWCIESLEGEGAVLHLLGHTYRRLGQAQKDIEFNQQADVILGEIQEDKKSGRMIEIYRHEQALLLAKRIVVRDCASDTKSTVCVEARKGEGTALNNLGKEYRLSYLNQREKAIEFYKKALAIYKAIGDLSGQGESLNNLGEIYLLMDEFQTSIKFYQQALDINRTLGDPNIRDEALYGLVYIYRRLSQYQKIIDVYQKYLQFPSIGEAYMRNRHLGDAYFNLGQYQKAIDFYQRSLASQKQSGAREAEGKTLNDLGLSFTKLNQTELAILFYKQSVNVYESIRKDIRRLDKDLQESYLSTVESTYRNLADLLLKQDRILEAQQVLDLLKVQELSDYLRIVRANTKDGQGVDMQRPEQNIIALASELITLQQRDRENKLTEPEQQRLAQLVQTEKDQNKQFNAFLNSPEVQKLIDELRRTEQQQNVNLANYRKLQKDVLAQMPNAVMIYPMILDDRLELILINAKTPPLRRTVNIKREQLNQEIADFLNDLRDAGSDDVKESAKKLYKLLIQPFESELQQLKIDTIIYAPDGQLRYIPLSALYDGKQWLVEKYRINNITAESLTSFNTKPIAKPHILAGAFGGKAGEKTRSGFNGLPATITEVKKIARLFPNTTTLIESAFTKEVTQTRANSHTILHLATHGELSIGTPENSFILFGDAATAKSPDDERATIGEIKEWSLSNVDLVILSACQTGIGNKLGSGVEILGLGYQMQTAGARVVIASLWKVNDEGTQALMEAFYSELKKGDVPIAEALRRAQVSLIKSSKFNHPNYWSAFFAIGNGL